MTMKSDKTLFYKKWIFFLTFCILEWCVFLIAKNHSSVKFELIHAGIFSSILVFYMNKNNCLHKTYGIHLCHPVSQLICSLVTAFVLLLTYFPFITDFRFWIYHELHLLYDFPISSLGLILLTAIYTEFVWRCFFLSFLTELTSETFSLISTSLLSGMLYFSGDFSATHLMQMVLFGFVMGYLRCKSPEKFSLFSLTIIHMIWCLPH